MATKKSALPEAVKPVSRLFNEQLRTALAYFTDSTWLGENSLLVAPYFLGAYLSKSSPKLRGEAL